jgi:hypothetical protein
MVCELELGRFSAYHTNYTGYLEEKEKRRDQLVKRQGQQAKEIGHVREFIARWKGNYIKRAMVTSRERMLDIAGRSRRPQMALARDLGINDYPCAAGGCLLTDPKFAGRIKDLIDHGELDMQNISLLKSGRYFRLSQNAKLIVGRNEGENKMLAILAKDGDILFEPLGINGPVAVGKGPFSSQLLDVSCRIMARYCDRNGKNYADISYRRLPDDQVMTVRSVCLDEGDLAKLRALTNAA